MTCIKGGNKNNCHEIDFVLQRKQKVCKQQNNKRLSKAQLSISTLKLKQLLDICSMICKQTITGCI